MTKLAPDTILIARELILSGRVQGIGLRPAIARWAAALSLRGRVSNTHRGVVVHVEGPAKAVERFEAEWERHLPAAAVVERIAWRTSDPTGCEQFKIVESDTDDAVAAGIPVDVATCGGCLSETLSDDDRRFGYAFTSCAECGPRYSILDAMPYERAQTSMAEFALCSLCHGEYTTPADRRFHAQTNACPACGPRLTCRDSGGAILSSGMAAVEQSARAIRLGRIVALLGVGGFQLVVDAASEQAVQRLRDRKGRRGKPLAVMVPSLDRAERVAVLDPSERKLLRGEAGPIVVARARAGSPLAPAVAPGLDSIGVMLPTSPLHALLLRACGVPLVVTSGNREGEPLQFEPRQALETLRGVADLWLDHNRRVRHPVDDSVVRVVAGRCMTIRLARGLAPLPLELPAPYPRCALGGHQKGAIALSNGEQSILAPHLGDMDSVSGRERFERHYRELSTLYGVTPRELVVDRHPDYFTAQWAEGGSLPVRRVQHHHAHIVAGMLEHHWLDRKVVGFAFDGTGYGDDGTIWGGEILIATACSWLRVGRIRPFPLAGGEAAMRQPWRVAAALVHEACGEDTARSLRFDRADPGRLLPLLRSRRLSPATSSAGRLFDGIASLALGIEHCQYEGQAAALLEAACDETEQGAYAIRLRDLRDEKLLELDWRPLVQSVLLDRRAGISPGAIAMRFHRGLAAAVVRASERFVDLPVVLGGGVFQNRILVELIHQAVAATGRPIGPPGMIPTNDGGLAAGQLAVAGGSQTAKQPGHTTPCV